MTKEKIESVLLHYKEYLIANGAENIDADYDRAGVHGPTAYNHLLSMIVRAEVLLEEGRTEKVFRWLGFIQGVLWMMGDFTLNDLMDHSRP